jgi:D-alanyl-D-alanine carboxypeptidase
MNLESALAKEFATGNWNVNAARLTGGLEAAGVGEAKRVDMIASVTKIYTATIFLRLQETGELSLDDPVSKWLPDEVASVSRQGNRVALTLRHLLSHSSGIPNYYKAFALKKSQTELEIAADPGWNFERAMNLAATGRPKFFPTARAYYSFTNYQLLDRILLIAAGGFATALRELITLPLGLEDTGVLSVNNLADFDQATPLHFGATRYLGARRLASLGAEGGMIASQSDVANFISALFQDKIITNALGQMMANPRPLFPGVDYGLGLMSFSKLITGRRGVVGHLGATGSVAAYHPESYTAVALASNQFRAGIKPLRALRRLI